MALVLPVLFPMGNPVAEAMGKVLTTMPVGRHGLVTTLGFDSALGSVCPGGVGGTAWAEFERRSVMVEEDLSNWLRWITGPQRSH